MKTLINRGGYKHRNSVRGKKATFSKAKAIKLCKHIKERLIDCLQKNTCLCIVDAISPCCEVGLLLRSFPIVHMFSSSH